MNFDERTLEEIHGLRVNIYLNHKHMEATLSVDPDGDIYACQATEDGSNCEKTFGERYSWYLGNYPLPTGYKISEVESEPIHGTFFKATIRSIDCIGRIAIVEDSIGNNHYYLCQNDLSGVDSSVGFNFKYNWIVTNLKKDQLKSEGVVNFEILPSYPRKVKVFDSDAVKYTAIILGPPVKRLGGFPTYCVDTLLPCKTTPTAAYHFKFIEELDDIRDTFDIYQNHDEDGSNNSIPCPKDVPEEGTSCPQSHSASHSGVSGDYRDNGGNPGKAHPVAITVRNNKNGRTNNFKF